MKIKINTWYKIPHFNGYEICFVKSPYPNYNDNKSCKVNLYGEECLVSLVSYKNFNKYPYGYLLPYYHKQKGNISQYYELSNTSNKRKKLRIEKIISLLEESDLDLSVNPNTLHIGSRNRVLATTDKSTNTMTSTMNSLITSTSSKKPEEQLSLFGSLIKKDVLIFY